MDQITDEERRRIAELVAEGAPPWKLHQEINRSRHAIRRAVVALYRPARREPRRSPLRLSLAEREEISRGLAAGWPVRAIARTVGRAPSTVCREVAANGGRERYRACAADRRAVRLMRRPKPAKLAVCPRLREVVEGKLELRWSPQQIAAWLALAYPDEPEMRVSHETIYLSLFVQARGALRKELFRCLRTGRARRRPRGLTVNNGQGKIRGKVSISERPAEAADRAVPGHWEGDIIFGTGRSAIATLVEPVRDARRAAPRARRRVGHRRAQPGHHRPAGPAAPLPDLGPGHGDGRARPVQRGHRSPGLLLRPALALAAGQQREHQRAAAPVLPPQHRLQGGYAK
jgi:IS30 family transposase